jgi:hypothetical protein
MILIEIAVEHKNFLNIEQLKAIMNISSYSNNSRLEKEYLTLAINLILNAANFGKLQNYTDKLNLNKSSFSSSLSNNHSANWNGNDGNQVGSADSII